MVDWLFDWLLFSFLSIDRKALRAKRMDQQRSILMLYEIQDLKKQAKLAKPAVEKILEVQCTFILGESIECCSYVDWLIDLTDQTIDRFDRLIDWLVFLLSDFTTGCFWVLFISDLIPPTGFASAEWNELRTAIPDRERM